LSVEFRLARALAYFSARDKPSGCQLQRVAQRPNPVVKSPIKERRVTALQEALDLAVASGKIAGAVATTGSASAVRETAMAGSANPATGAAITADSIFQIASMTKAVTSVAAMQLVEQGRIGLDSPLGDAVPDLADPQVIDGFGEDGSVRLRAAKRPITLRHLLSHTSGFGYDFMSADLLRSRGPGGPPTPGTLDSIKGPLLFDPGDNWNYGVSTDWAGRVVEAITGEPLGAGFERTVCGPLGMVDTGFDLADDKADRLVALQLRQPDGSLAPMPMAIGGGPTREFDAGGAGLYSTASDYLRFVRMLLNGGTLDGVQLLKAETVAEMTRNQIGNLRAGQMESVMPMLALPGELFPDQHCGWSLGFLINPEPGHSGRAAGSQAWAGIANSYYWFDPANDVATVLMMQFLPFGDEAALETLWAVERAVYSG
jgi:methyl acetate hydrolase